MGITKRMAVAVSGLMFAGGAALAVSAAGSASAETPVAAPQYGHGGCRSCGRGRGCCSRNNHHFRHSERSHWRNHDRAIVLNRNQNWGRSLIGQHQRQQQKEEQEFEQPREQEKPDVMKTYAPGVPTIGG
jgi:hypothetical protein